MSKFSKQMGQAMTKIYNVMATPSKVTVFGKTINCDVVLDEDFDVLDDMQKMVKVACLKRVDVPKLPTFGNGSLIIEADSKTYVADGLFTGTTYQSDDKEWCIAIREIK